MKPVRLLPLNPSRRLFAAPACVRLRRLLRMNKRVCDLAYAVVGVAGCVLIARYLSIGLVPA